MLKYMTVFCISPITKCVAVKTVSTLLYMMEVRVVIRVI